MNKSDVVESMLIRHLAAKPSLISTLNDNLFTGIRLKIFHGLRSLYTASEPVDLKSPLLSNEQEVIDEASGIAMMDLPEMTHEACVAYLRDNTIRIEAIKTLRKVMADLNDPATPAIDSITKAASCISTTVINGAVSVKNGSDFTNTNKRIEWIAANPGKIRGATTGITHLDRLINGLWPRYYLIGARPSVGKSSIAGNFLTSLCDAGKPVLLFTLEMNADDFRERLISSMSGVSLTTYRNTTFTSEEILKLTKAKQQMRKWRWFIDDSSRTIEQIEAIALSWLLEYPDGHVFIDYIQLIEGGKGGNTNERIGNISGRLKAITQIRKAAVYALAQLRRSEAIFDKDLKRTVVKEPRIDELRDSGSLEQDADCAMLIHRDIVETPEDAKLIIAKQRSGPTGSIPMKFVPHTTTFYHRP